MHPLDHHPSESVIYASPIWRSVDKLALGLWIRF